MADYKRLNMTLGVVKLTEEQLRESTEELVWNGVTSIADKLGIDYGSDHFTLLYQGISNEFDFVKQHHCYLQYGALQVVNQLFSSGKIGMVLPKGSTDQDVQDIVEAMAAAILTNFAWMYASAFFSWLDDEDWEVLDKELTRVTFEFTVPAELQITEEGDNDD